MAKKILKRNKFNSRKDRDEFNSFVWAHVGKILSCGNLGHFEMRTLQSVPGEVSEGGQVAMHIEVDHKYMFFTLTYHDHYAAKAWEEKDYEELLKTLCHEMAHILTTEPMENLKMTGKVSYHFERLTESVSRWLYTIYRDYMEDFAVDIKTGKSDALRAFVKNNKK